MIGILPDTIAGYHCQHERRRGFIYVFILMTAMFVSVVGLAGLTMMRIYNRNYRDSTDLTAARYYALSAIELGFFTIAANSNWRSDYGVGQWFNHPIGSGQLALYVVDIDDGDGNQNNNDVVLIGKGVQGDAIHTTEVTLTYINNVLAIKSGSWQQNVSP